MTYPKHDEFMYRGPQKSSDLWTTEQNNRKQKNKGTDF